MLIINSANCQNATDTISIVRNNGIAYVQNNIMLTPNRLTKVLKTNVNAHKEFRAAKNNLFFSSVFSYAGGYFIGYPVGVALAGGKPVWGMAAVGVGLIAVSVPLRLAYTRRTENAIRIYNNDLRKTGYIQSEMRISATSNGFGFVLNF